MSRHLTNLDDFYEIRPSETFYELWQIGDRLIEEEDVQPDKRICVCVDEKSALEVRRRIAGRVQVRVKPEFIDDVAAEPISRN